MPVICSSDWVAPSATSASCPGARPAGRMSPSFSGVPCVDGEMSMTGSPSRLSDPIDARDSRGDPRLVLVVHLEQDLDFGA